LHLAMPSAYEHFHDVLPHGSHIGNLQSEQSGWETGSSATSSAPHGLHRLLVVAKPRFHSFVNEYNDGVTSATRPTKAMRTALDTMNMPSNNTTITPSDRQASQMMNTPSSNQQLEQGKSSTDQEEEVLRSAQERVSANTAEDEFQNTPTSDLKSDMPEMMQAEEEGKQMKMQDLVAALREADASETPETIQLEPSIETVVKEAGPEVLGHSIDDVSRTLHALSKQANENLSPERIAAMTAQDAPQMLTPVAQSLHAVLRSTGVLRHKLASIAEASNALLSRAEARGAERLKAAEAAIHKADIESKDTADKTADQENCPNDEGKLLNSGDASSQDTQLVASQDFNQPEKIRNQMMPFLVPLIPWWPVRRSVARRKPHDVLRWPGQQQARLQWLPRQAFTDFL